MTMNVLGCQVIKSDLSKRDLEHGPLVPKHMGRGSQDLRKTPAAWRCWPRSAAFAVLKHKFLSARDAPLSTRAITRVLMSAE
jgi:hypothetical protein